MLFYMLEKMMAGVRARSRPNSKEFQEDEALVHKEERTKEGNCERRACI